MPCACKPEHEDYPDTADWGSIFWSILHGLAEHCGKQTDINLQTDELRLWVALLTGLSAALPCDECREHYKQYLSRNPIYSLKTMKYEQLGEWTRVWLWKLHNSVNKRLGKQEFDFQDLEETYKTVCIPTQLAMAEPVMRRAIRLNGLTLRAWKGWVNTVRTLISMY